MVEADLSSGTSAHPSSMHKRRRKISYPLLKKKEKRRKKPHSKKTPLSHSLFLMLIIIWFQNSTF